jgi:hypothetical protein
MEDIIHITVNIQGAPVRGHIIHITVNNKGPQPRGTLFTYK